MCKCAEAPMDRGAPEEEQELDAENHFNLPTMAELEAAMCSPETSIVRKMAHLFSIKKHGGAGAMNLILESLNHDDGSILFRHEATYVLGQLGCQDAGEPLLKILKDTSEDEMVRHEAAEALSALGYESSLPVLQQVAADPSVPLTVRQTCELSIHSLLSKINGKAADGDGAARAPAPASVDTKDESWWLREDNAYRDRQFNTVDPSEPYPNCTPADVPWLSAQLLNDEESLWNRYRAMTTLRNLNSPKATAMLALVLSRDSSSAILRHEIAFVLGQLRIPSGSACDASVQDDAPAPESHDAANVPPRYRETPEFLKEHLNVEHNESTAARATFCALSQCLKNAGEHPMARHEAALALGSLGASAGAAEARWEDGKTSVQDTIIRLLQTYANDPDRVVRESCLVGLDSMQEELGLELGVC
ncbi:UNVERIFIED_CONTAM: HEAT repeat-containing protein [Hammondia hammondi]|eukprot:XP_008889190.1 HEAT repeat-containing protein [Hammondia hammondi]